MDSPLMKTRRVAETDRPMNVIPPLKIFVDESGSTDFGEPKEDEPKKALAVVAVAVPTMHFKAIQSLLPRNAAGKFLKAQDREFHAGTALTFVNKLISSTANVGAFLVDPGAVKNIELANANAKLANDRREIARKQEVTEEGKHMHPPISPHDLHYMVFLSQALFACLEVYSFRNGGMPSFVDIVVDTKDIDESQRQRFVRELRRISNKYGLIVGEFVWKREEDEPLLLLPDLFGGILCREDRFRDVGAAAHKLWDAERAGRFKFVNKPPSERAAEAKGGGTVERGIKGV